MTRQNILYIIVFLFAVFLLFCASAITENWAAIKTVDAFTKVQVQDAESMVRAYEDSLLGGGGK